MMAKRIVTKLGDIFEVPLEDNLKAYFQYIMRDFTNLNGDVIRVFKRRYTKDEVLNLDDVVEDDVEFYVQTSVLAGAKQGLWNKMGNIKVPSDIERPCFRATDDAGNLDIKVSERWYIWRANDEDFTYVGKFEKKYHHCDKGGILPPFAIKNRIETGDDGFFEHGF